MSVVNNMDACTRIFVLTIFVHLCCITLLTSHFGICTGTGSSSEIKCIPSEREALLKFKRHLEDPSNRFSSWNASNPNCCHWAGVVCSNVTAHVLQLHLNTSLPTLDVYVSIYEYIEAIDAYERSSFGGEINHSLVDLKHLNYLDLSGNDFGGMQIPSFLCAITTLTHLNLSDAGFDGNIPRQIGNLSNLLYLDLAFASNGTIPYQIGNLTNLLRLDLRSYYEGPPAAKSLHWLSGLSSLQYLDLSNANLSKSFDWLQTMQALPSLVELRLGGCDFSEYEQPSTLNFSSLLSLTISVAPKWIFGLNKLVSLRFHTIYLSRINGPIPNGIQNLTLLENLDLSDNSFSSSIPNWLYGLHHLKFLNLRFNNLNGTISDVVGNLTSLVSLDLSANKFQGVIPTSIGNLTSLISLDFSGNKFEGVIPTSLGNLTSLVSLDLSGNKFEGVIPTSLGKLCNLREISFSNLKYTQQVSEILEILTPCVSRGLKSLQVSSSQISGQLTDQLRLFKNLVSLDFSNNSIIGIVPRSLRELSSLRQLGLSKNQLTGNPFKILGSIPKLSYLAIDDNLFQGVVHEDDLANFITLRGLYASGNNLTLTVDPKWQPNFQVTTLDMNSWKLGPSFPSWIKSQKELDYLDMANTGISDSIPTWFWKTISISHLHFLNLSHNHIRSELPNTLKNLESIMVDLSSNSLFGKLPYPSVGMLWLDLSNNSYSGSMTDFLCEKHDGPKQLQFLNLASNNLSGEIPDCWKMWPHLVDVNLQSNYFIGNLPSSMGSLAWLQSLHMRNNKLSGKFPLISKNSSELIFLDLGENNLTGVIPTWVGERLINLKILRLRSNKFSGNIPNGICDMKFLQDLDLAQNRLSSNIPYCFNNLSTMLINKSNTESSIHENILRVNIISVILWVKGIGVEYRNILGLVKSIDLSENKLSGEIPREITKLSGLIFLNLSRNQLSGHIPQSIGNMVSLESIDFSINQLSGEIPTTITNLSFLSKLDLSYNHLKGKIPTGTQLQSFEASNFVGNNLRGPPLPINCSLDVEVSDADHNNRESNRHRVNWFLVSMAFGFIVGFWGVVAPLFIYRSWRHAYFRFLDDMWCKLQSRW